MPPQSRKWRMEDDHPWEIAARSDGLVNKLKDAREEAGRRKAKKLPDLAKRTLRVFLTKNPASDIKHRYKLVPKQFKDEYLAHLLKKMKGSAMVFVNDFTESRRLVDMLRDEHSVKALAIHGNMRRDKRRELLEMFKGGAYRALICTDLTKKYTPSTIDNVIHYDLPRGLETYINRIDRKPLRSVVLVCKGRVVQFSKMEASAGPKLGFERFKRA